MTSSPPPSSVMAAFDLPAMPPSFEDFQFSLNLPENITASDFGLVSSPQFGNLFGLGSSGPFTPSALIAASEESTPKGATGMNKSGSTDDTIMSNPLSRRPSISSALGLGMDSQMTNMPSVLTGGNNTSTGMVPPQNPFASTAASAVSAAPAGNMTFEEYMARNAHAFPGTVLSHVQQHPQQPMQQMQHQQMPAMPVSAGGLDLSKSLFDANEANFLTNFLQGFEGWDFNPNLPLDLPSFADAERGAFAMGVPNNNMINNNQAQASGSEPRRHGRKSTGGGKTVVSPRASLGLSQASPMGSGRIDGSAGAAFGRHMAEWNEQAGGGDENAVQHREDRGRRKSGLETFDDASLGKKLKVEHGNAQQQTLADQAAAAASKRELLSDHEKRQNHILSEQRRRNHIREAFKELVDLLEAGREFGARGLGMSSGAGTGIEDEGLDDRSDYESTLEDEEASAATKRRKAKAKRRAAMEAILSSGGRLTNGSVATRGRGKGRGRGGSAGGGAGSKSAVLFQAVDLLRWLEGRNEVIGRHVQELEEAAPPAVPAVKAA